MSDNQSQESNSESPADKKTTPLRCFMGSLTAGMLALIPYYLTTSIAETYADKPVISANPVVINIATAVRTLVVGVATLATATFGLVALGLFLLGLQVTFNSVKQSME